MAIYFGLIAFVILIPLATEILLGSKTIATRVSLFLSIGALFLLFSLKATTVGRDIAGYEFMYEQFKSASWSNFDLYWTEWGYELLEMIFTHIFHASFHTFMVCIYGFLCLSYFMFIKRYSADPLFSVLIYICFTFMIFDMSAVRNLIAVAICLFAFPYAQKETNIKNILIYFGLTLIAAQIHSSAYVFAIVFFVVKIRVSVKSLIFYIGVPAMLLLAKTYLYGIINTYLKKVEDVGALNTGGNLYFMLAILLFSLFVSFYLKRQEIGAAETMNLQHEKSNIRDSGLSAEGLLQTLDVSDRLMYMTIIIQIFAAGSILTRLAQYVQIFMIIIVPNTFAMLEVRTRVILKMVFYTFFIWYFWRYGLSVNSLDIVPYDVFWHQ